MLTYYKPDLVIRINYEKCTVILRNAQLVELAKHKIGNTTSQIYAQLLNLLEPKLVRCAPEMDSEGVSGPTATIEQIAAALDKDIDPGFGIGKTPSARPDKTKVEKTNQTRKNAVVAPDAKDTGMVNGKSNGVHGNGHLVNADEDSEEESDDPFAPSPVKPPKRQRVTFQDDHVPRYAGSEEKASRVREVRNHIELLQYNDCPFVYKSALNGGGGYSVNFETVVHYMREAEMDQLLLDMFGDKGLRMLRIFKKYGKIDEKALEKIALIKQKDVRTKLAEMQMAGVVEIQEVPKDANRNNGNSRTLFLWFYDRDRVLQMLLDRVLKAMSRLLQRLAHERRGAQTILELIERSDLQHADPEAYLEPHQFEDLQNIRRKEAMLMGQIGRLDELIGIFRDY
jgi:DNA-directed RNA polymerase III subunit RPC3